MVLRLRERKLKWYRIINNFFPKGFITYYHSGLAVEVFEPEVRWVLKLLGKLMWVWILPVLSRRCFHTMGGAKMMLREVIAWIQPGDFVYKTDVRSYFASINHSILFRQLVDIKWPQRFMALLVEYCRRTTLTVGPSIMHECGIPKGGSISNTLGALYLTPLDQAMEKWLERGDCFYARFQDDIILISRKRYVMRSMRLEMHKILKALRLGLRPEKTFVGRLTENNSFDLLGYDVNVGGLRPNQISIDRMTEKAKQRYAQGGVESLRIYLKRWRQWSNAGLLRWLKKTGSK